jgi:hypothetical protein
LSNAISASLLLMCADARAPQNRRQQLAMVDTDDEIVEAKLDQRIRHRCAQLRFDSRRGRPE